MEKTPHDHVFDRLRSDIDIAVSRKMTGLASMNGILRFAAKWRSQLIAETIVARDGLRVQSGPFQGMEYVAAASEGALAARLLGCYEAELHPHLAAFAAEAPATVLNIGCAEGYYSVGLARLIPGATVHAFDTDSAARDGCADLAKRNGVADRVVIAGTFEPSRFAEFPAGSLVVLDIEGGEVDLLNPATHPALAGFSLIVETHPGLKAGATDIIKARFAPTHEIIRVDPEPHGAVVPDWLRYGNHLDLVLALWEWRASATPWLVMRPKI